MHAACVRGANRKHPLHACNAGRVEVQRLVERRRVQLGALYALDRVRVIGLGLGLGLDVWFMVRVGGFGFGFRLLSSGRGTKSQSVARGDTHSAHAGQDTDRRACAEGKVLSAHRKHVVHLCDAGRVEAQRLVERLRFLCQVEATW